jgi:hypothetical protein
LRWTLIRLLPFNRLWRQERLTDKNLQSLELAIMANPGGAAVMKGTGGLRKIRFAPRSRGKGKSGSMRVGYAQFPEYGRIYLVTMFLKRDAENLTAADFHAIRSALAILGATLKEGREP